MADDPVPGSPTLAEHPDDETTALVRADVVVPGTADDVWWSVATGAGIGTWFVPTRVQERVGGAVVADHGPFGHSHGTVTAYDPPERFAYEERDWAPDAPAWRTEILVRPRGADACAVALTSGVIADGPRWREAVAATEEGWRADLRNLRLARTHFGGLSAGTVLVLRNVGLSPEAAWTALLGALGFVDAAEGDDVAAPSGAPSLAGTVEEVRAASLLLRTTAPAPGLVELSAQASATTSLVVRGHLYGPAGPALAEAVRPGWDAWLHARFPGARPR